jgi:hypothetical protein
MEWEGERGGRREHPPAPRQGVGDLMAAQIRCPQRCEGERAADDKPQVRPHHVHSQATVASAAGGRGGRVYAPLRSSVRVAAHLVSAQVTDAAKAHPRVRKYGRQESDSHAS